MNRLLFAGLAALGLIGAGTAQADHGYGSRFNSHAHGRYDGYSHGRAYGGHGLPHGSRGYWDAGRHDYGSFGRHGSHSYYMPGTYGRHHGGHFGGY